MVLDRFRKSRPSVFIYCASNRSPQWGTALTVRDAMFHAAKNGVDTQMTVSEGESLICRARQNALVSFMQKRTDFMFSFDDDVTMPHDTITKLVEADKDIIAGIYRLKRDEVATAVRLPKSGPTMNKVLAMDMITPATYVSTGCFMVKRSVIEGMIEKYPELHYRRNITGDQAWALYMPYIYNGEYLSEDWAFCQRAREAGFEVWLHGGVKCGHWGKKLYAF